MARYFFHVHDGEEDIFDTVGTDCKTVREMRLHMLQVASAAVARIPETVESFSMETMDARGQIVGSMDFGLLGSFDFKADA